MNPLVHKVSDARQAALDILTRLDAPRRTLDQVVDTVLDAAGTLSKQDRSLVTALVYGVLRWRGRLDWIIGQFSNTPFQKIDPAVLNILRLGCFQILHMTRIPASAAVNTSVELTKSIAPPWTVKFVNGMLRNIVRKGGAVTFPDRRRQPEKALSVDQSMPEWLVKKWMKRFGIEDTRRLCEAVNAIPPLTVRTNTLRCTRDALIASLAPQVGEIHPTPFSAEGLQLRRLKATIAELEAFRKGWFQVQDEAAQLIAYLVAPRAGQTVLDACAGLGGKTAHLAQFMGDKGQIVALDRSEEKLQRLKSEMQRLGISSVTARAQDLKQPLSDSYMARFDRVLLDAPCSGLGVIRRNPDIKWAAAKRELIPYQETQAQFLDQLAACVKPGGLLVYAVCSFETEETEAVVKRFLSVHPEFSLQTDIQSLPPGADTLMDDGGCFRPLPHRHAMDGFFGARFRRTQ